MIEYPPSDHPYQNRNFTPDEICKNVEEYIAYFEDKCGPDHFGRVREYTAQTEAEIKAKAIFGPKTVCRRYYKRQAVPTVGTIGAGYWVGLSEGVLVPDPYPRRGTVPEMLTTYGWCSSRDFEDAIKNLARVTGLLPREAD